MSLITVSLKHCDYVKERRQLRLASEFFAGCFPKEFFVESHHTGRVVRFTVVGPEDKLFDQDQWDGEMMIYRPVGGESAIQKVDHLVVEHQW